MQISQIAQIVLKIKHTIYTVNIDRFRNKLQEISAKTRNKRETKTLKTLPKYIFVHMCVCVYYIAEKSELSGMWQTEQ